MSKLLYGKREKMSIRQCLVPIFVRKETRKEKLEARVIQNVKSTNSRERRTIHEV